MIFRHVYMLEGRKFVTYFKAGYRIFLKALLKKMVKKFQI